MISNELNGLYIWGITHISYKHKVVFSFDIRNVKEAGMNAVWNDVDLFSVRVLNQFTVLFTDNCGMLEIVKNGAFVIGESTCFGTKKPTAVKGLMTNSSLNSGAQSIHVVQCFRNPMLIFHIFSRPNQLAIHVLKVGSVDQLLDLPGCCPQIKIAGLKGALVEKSCCQVEYF